MAVVVATGVLLPTTLASQQADSIAAGPRRIPQATAQQSRLVARDSTKPPISPGRAFLYSLALPGLGQSRLQRAGAGAFYFFFEGLSTAMATKAIYDLRIAREHRHDAIAAAYTTNANGEPVVSDTLRNRYAGSRLKARRTHVEDWVALLIFNHLFSGADAYVSAQLWDLPIQLGLRAAPAVGLIGVLSRY
ncbi:MAG: hypothetical protein MNPFHGCM_01502 [Gemmatimonadaceae bacterium]|nr:hypothetical protein [Gemmatimonadaceae bacterium]